MMLATRRNRFLNSLIMLAMAHLTKGAGGHLQKNSSGHLSNACNSIYRIARLCTDTSITTKGMTATNAASYTGSFSDGTDCMYFDFSDATTTTRPTTVLGGVATYPDCTACLPTSCTQPSSVLLTLAGGNWGWTFDSFWACSTSITSAVLFPYCFSTDVYRLSAACSSGGVSTQCVGMQFRSVQLVYNAVFAPGRWALSLGNDNWSSPPGNTNRVVYQRVKGRQCDMVGTYYLASSVGCSSPPATVGVS